MQLTVLTAPASVAKETMLVNTLFEAGMPKLHLRKPEWTREEIVAYLREIEAPFLKRVSLHSHYQVAKDFALGGVHFTEKKCCELGSTINCEIQSWRKAGFHVSRAVHDMDTLKASGNDYDYLLASPVFESISKTGHRPSFLWDVQKVKAGITAKVFALGGIVHQKVEAARKLGFDGVATLGHLWKRPEQALENFKSIMKVCQAHAPMS